jgi:hypothetical protein
LIFTDNQPPRRAFETNILEPEIMVDSQASDLPKGSEAPVSVEESAGSTHGLQNIGNSDHVVPGPVDPETGSMSSSMLYLRVNL